MGENKNIIEMKKRSLKEELNSENPNPKKIKRLKESIERHKDIARHIRDRRQKSKRNRE